VASKSQEVSKAAPREARKMDENPRVHETAIIALELKCESKDEMSNLNDLLIGMRCAQYTDTEITAVLGILN